MIDPVKDSGNRVPVHKGEDGKQDRNRRDKTINGNGGIFPIPIEFQSDSSFFGRITTLYFSG